MSRRQKRLRAKHLRHAQDGAPSTRTKLALGAAVTAGAALAVAPAASAQEYVVTNLSDNDAGSLRNRIQAANGNAGPDEIVFQSGLSGTITLDTELTFSYEELSVSAPSSADITIDGGDAFAIFATSSDLSVEGLTLANGRRSNGPAIYVDGADLTVSDTEFTGSYAWSYGGAIAAVNGASVSVESSLFDDNLSYYDGGAISSRNGGDVVVSGSTFVGNGTDSSEGSGGAISATGSGTFEVSASTFTGNTAGEGGGAVHAVSSGPQSIADSTFSGNHSDDRGGSAIFTASAPGGLTIANATVTGNTASGTGGSAIRAVSGTTTVESSTITGNSFTGSVPNPTEEGSGIGATSTEIELHNSIVTGNTPADLSSFPAGDGFNTSFDLIGVPGEATVTETVPGSNLDHGLNPYLGALRDNGGPVETMMPGATVVNKGSTALTLDARGQTRPVDFPYLPFSLAAGANGADLGAVEAQLGEQIDGPTSPTGPTGPTGPTQPTGPTGPTGPTMPIAPSNAFTFGKVKLNKKRGTAALQVKVPGKGIVQLLGSKTVKPMKKLASRKATVALTVKAKGKAARQLKRTGRTKLKTKVRFTPTGGQARTKSKTVKLVRRR